MAQAPRTIGEHVWDTVLETPHPYPPGDGVDGEPVWTQRYRYPNAAYLVFEFKRFDLAPGDRVEVRDPQRKQVHVYTGKGFKEKGGDFVTKMILGSEAIIELYAGNREHDHYGYRIERITRGYSQSELQELYGTGATRAICGSDDKEDAVCYETSFPEVYDKSRAVARIVMDGSALCTAWLVSCENHVMTNNHCTWDDSDFDTQGELDRMEFQFMYQDDTCGGGGSSIGYSFMGGTWLENDRNLDYTLIQAPEEEDPASVYGWLLIDDRLVDIDEQIYIVGHPSGRPKEISLYSTDATDQDNPDGFCEVFTQTAPVCVGGSVPEIGYYCDTEGGNSGSPVLSRETNKVVALHHCANCPNRGVRIQNVLQANLAGSNPLPACSLFDDAGAVALDAAAYACSSTATIEVNDGSLRGTGSVDVRIWSDSEPEAETVTLGETGSDSGRFVGSFALASSTAVPGDGMLSVFDGDSITVQYVDADDGQGGTDILREDSAVVDCQAPTISDVQAGAVTGQSAVISWLTNEPADSEVSYAISPPEWSTTRDSELVTDHAVTLEGLDACSIYQFWVSSTDWTGNAVASDNDGALFSFETGVDNILETTSTDTPIPIVDNTTFTSEVTIDSTETVLDVDVRLNATHTYDGDLDIFLIGPDGTRVELTSDNGGTGENFVNTVFDDEADVSIVGSSAPFTGRFRPEGSLATLDGQPAAGVWTLEVTDDAGADQGELIDWAPILTFEARDCGAVGEFTAYELATDTCSTDSTGSDNGRWESGEKIELQLDVRNAGTDPLTDAWVQVRPLTTGVVMLDDSATVGTLAPGAVGSTRSPHVIVYLEESLDCGATLEFEVEVFADEGSWPAGFQQVLGEPVAEDSGVTLSEKFTGGIPVGWSVVDGLADGATWFADSASDPAGCGSTDPGTPISGSWAAVDSSCTSGGTRMDEELITPVLSFAGQPIVTLEFDHWFEWNSQRTDEIADVDVRSSLTGGQWVNLARFTGASTANPAHETIDLSSFAGDATDVEIRWHYYDAQRDSYWYVDNVDVSYRVPAVCFNQTCPAPTAVPSPVPDGSTGTSPLRADRVVPDGSQISLAWDDQCQSGGAKLIYGPLDQVATYAVSGAVCDVATPELWDAVPEGSLYFLLLGGDPAGVESSWGAATDGERNGLTPSYTCGDIAKEMTGSCP
jgi:subtilisin-like proprotein convertase family protein/V8-like Glu-specific endopeptidase